MTCSECGTEFGASLLSCPGCHALVHAEELRRLSRRADAARRDGDASTELATWRDALVLLPPTTTQAAHVRARIEALSLQVLEPPPLSPPEASHAGAWSTGAVAGLALLAWKFKAVLLFAVTKGKLLALGLTNSTTVVSMVPALAVYWMAFGWRFAAGLIASIYVHEMGHVAALSRFGIAASAPMFLPGLGAIIRSRHVMVSPRESARVGLAGPIWGLGAALAAWSVWRLGGGTIWLALTQFGALINLFNLAPVWQLDGAHAFRALNRLQRGLATMATAVAFAVTREGMLLLVGALALMQTFRDAEHAEGDAVVCIQFAGLVVVLSLLSTLPVPDLTR